MPFSDPLDSSIAVDGVYYIDYSTNADGTIGDPDFASYYCALPENLEFDDAISGPGNCSWEWTLGAEDMEGNPILSHNFMGPMRSFFRLRCGNDVIMAGPIVGLNSRYSDQFMKVAAKTWEHYYERYQFPFDPRPDHVNDYRFDNTFQGNEAPTPTGNPTPTGLVYQAYNRDIALIAHNLVRRGVHDVANRLNFDVNEYTNPVGIRTNYQFTLGDSSYISDILNGLASTGEGFDWWIGSADRVNHIGSPYRYGSNMSPSTVYNITKDMPGLIDLDFNNDGIVASHVLGQGAGLASQTQLGSAFGSQAAQDVFHRLDASYDFGDVRNRDQLEHKTQKRLALDGQPAHQVTVTLDPAQISNFWSTFRKGRAVYVLMDMGWHLIDASHQILSYSCKNPGQNETGAMEVDLTLKRIYAIQVSDASFDPAL